VSTRGPRADRLARWASQPANLTFAVALAGIVFTTAFWAITSRFEPTLVATFGGMLTASGLLAGRQPPPADPPPEIEEPSP
jgi:hypothetical protein